MSSQKFVDSLPAGATLLWYEIVKVLGKGGFGITYLARDTNLDQMVAIKEYLPAGFAVRENGRTVQPNSPTDSKTYQWGLDRFLKEAQTLARFRHPSIVRVMSFFRDSNTAYMVMEYEEGDSLDQFLKRKKTLTQDEILDFLPSLLEGLAELHQNDFIHRDIKPANILIRKDGSPVILDFGSARQAIAGQGEQMTSLLSLGYSPFEQYDSSGDRQGPWSDIYAMGGVLYRAVSGAKPPDAALRINARLRNQADPMTTAEERGRGRFSEGFLKAIDRALMVIETERPQSIAEWKPLLLGCGQAPPPVDNRDEGRQPPSPEPSTQRQGEVATEAKPAQPRRSPGAQKKKKNSWRSFIASMNEFGSATRRGPTTRPAKKSAPAERSKPEPEPSTQAMAPSPSATRPKPVDQRQTGDVWSEPVTGMDFLWIPAGEFYMGSSKGAPGRRSDEAPEHQVALDGFWIGKTPVTWGQWKTVMGNPRGLYSADKDRCPVERVSWDDIQEFIRKVSRVMGTWFEIRLPTEAEWEYAARAGSDAIFYFGNDPSLLGKHAWFGKNAQGRSRPVGEKEPNPWGLYDVLGNVWEWTSDWYAEDYYARSPARNPGGAAFGKARVRRGGCFRSQLAACRVAHRNRVSATAMGDTLGFRLVGVDDNKE